MAKVLLVEDDNNLREIFEMRLQAEGYDTITASDGEEALVVATKEKPDLIIADVMMPKLSGFEMLETLRAAPEMGQVKVIMMTALGQAEDRTRGEKLGVIKYLVKSQVTLEDFVRAVSEVLSPTGQTNTSTDNANANKPNNNQESEKPMDDSQNAPTTPPADGSGANPMGGDSAAPAPADDSQMSTSEEQGVVDNQVNDFAGGAAGSDSAAPAPAEDAPAPAGDSSAPAAEPAAEEPKSDAPAAS
jgi:CheY-like chemotaxis protein